MMSMFPMPQGKCIIRIVLVKIPPQYADDHFALFELSQNENAADRAVKEIEINIKFVDAPNAEAVLQHKKLYGGMGEIIFKSGVTVKDFSNTYENLLNEEDVVNKNRAIYDAYSVKIMQLHRDAVSRIGDLFYTNEPLPADIIPENTPIKSGRYVYVIVLQDKENPANIAYRYRLMNMTVELTHDEKLLSLYPDVKKKVSVSGDKYSDKELARAVELGFGATQSVDSYITFADFMKMLDKTVELADKSKLAAWRKVFPEARKSDEIITRYEAMETVLRCAQVLGDAYTKFNYDGDLGKVVQAVQGGSNNDAFWDSIWEKSVGIKDYLNNLHTVNANFGDGYKPHPCTCIDYSVGRVSLASKKPLFEYDTKKEVPLRPGEPLTYTEGLLVALRLHESARH